MLHWIVDQVSSRWRLRRQACQEECCYRAVVVVKIDPKSPADKRSQSAAPFCESSDASLLVDNSAAAN